MGISCCYPRCSILLAPYCDTIFDLEMLSRSLLFFLRGFEESVGNEPLEAECKFRVEDARLLEERLARVQALFIGTESHCDTYLRHPSRDFRQTDEALRVREIDGQPHITYKGPRQPGPIKIRRRSNCPWFRTRPNLGFRFGPIWDLRSQPRLRRFGRSMKLSTMEGNSPSPSIAFPSSAPSLK